MNDFNQTVNLKDKMDLEEKARREAMVRREQKPKKKVVKKEMPTKNEDIDRFINDEVDGEKKVKNNFAKINRPASKENGTSFVNIFVIAVLLVLVGFFAYDRFFDKSASLKEKTGVVEEKWYMVKLGNDETFYGLIGDVKADPIEIKNVYYNYDQINDGEKTDEAPSTNLRLVKRGKEKHGPDGSLNIIRSQVVYLEPLRPDSKVLEAILNYEK